MYRWHEKSIDLGPGAGRQNRAPEPATTTNKGVDAYAILTLFLKLIKVSAFYCSGGGPE